MNLNNCGDGCVKVGLIQMSVAIGEVRKNIDKAAQMITDAAQKGAKVVALPELWNCGYCLDRLSELAETLGGESVMALRRLAKEHSLIIFGGSIGEVKDGKYYNTSMAIDTDGSIINKYRKVHLFRRGLCEHEYFSPGDQWALAETPYGTAGLMICYDLRFPEYSRNLVLRGANLLIYPAQWPVQRLYAWKALTIARAIENECFVIAVNRAGNDDFDYPGHSALIDPWGKIITEGSDMESVIIGEMDLSMLSDRERRLNMIDERRQILDEIDDTQI